MTEKAWNDFLGVVNYVEKFIPDIAAVTKPIRDLLKTCPIQL